MKKDHPHKGSGETPSFWRGRLSRELTPEARRYIGSMSDDLRIVEADIDVNTAHSLMLCKQGVIKKHEAQAIVTALQKAREDWRTNSLPIPSEAIDIHPLVEKYVIDQCGLAVGGKIHSAKSRNDQVVTDIRIHTRNEILSTLGALLELCSTLLSVAEDKAEIVMPGYTHSQHAQVTTFGHYLVSYAAKFLPDVDRLLEAYARVNISPLGAGPLAGSSFPIDRDYTAALLGFDGVTENSIDAISSRDWALETLYKLANIMVGLSRMSADLIEWSSYEYGFVQLSDEYCDVSSAMPQKRNPDVLETMRSKASEALSLLDAMSRVLTGLRTGYSKDLQVTKTYLWSSFDITKPSIALMSGVLKTLIVRDQRLSEVVAKNHLTVYDLAEYLAQKKALSFRESYALVGQVVNKLELGRRPFSDLKPLELAAIAKDVLGKSVVLSQDEITEATDPKKSLQRRTTADGPNPDMLRKTVRMMGKALTEKTKQVGAIQERLRKARERFDKDVSHLIGNNRATISVAHSS
jgi:argininosuccinate lyase